VINLNADLEDATHYHHTLALVGDVRRTLVELNRALETGTGDKAEWLQSCAAQKTAWQSFKAERLRSPVLMDEYWGVPVLTQPAAIQIATAWAKSLGAVCFFDAGDVQANGFQVVEDDHPGQTFTETGASYMGFAVSALLATGVASSPFYGLALTGDGSFSMNPQILIDGSQHGAHGCILLLDNGRMGAITGLQEAQYGAGFATWNTLRWTTCVGPAPSPDCWRWRAGARRRRFRLLWNRPGAMPGWRSSTCRSITGPTRWAGWVSTGAGMSATGARMCRNCAMRSGCEERKQKTKTKSKKSKRGLCGL
jgi:hypothetical protein